MHPTYKVLCLNGPNKGKEVEVTAAYDIETYEQKKQQMMFQVEGIHYAGWCRYCNEPVLMHQARYIENVNGLGQLYVDVFHKNCCK